jgi:hypothetical protein
MGVTVVTQQINQNPPLMFEVREGMGVAVVTQKKILKSLAHIWSEGGGGGGHCCLEKNTRTPCCIQSEGGDRVGHCHPEKNTRTPLLTFEVRVGEVAVVTQKISQDLSTHICCEGVVVVVIVILLTL